jgi:hypothetical protein
MPASSHTSPTRSPSHDLVIERRLTWLEVTLTERMRQTDSTLASLDGRLKYIEKAMPVLIWAIGALATKQSGDIAEKLLGLLKP